MDKNPVAEVARAATRPIVTIIFAGVIAAAVLDGIHPPDWFVYGLAMPCILWWFGERTVNHIKDKKVAQNSPLKIRGARGVMKAKQ